MKKNVLLIIIIIFSNIFLYSDNKLYITQFNEANYLYKNDNYKLAINSYLNLLKNGYDNFEINYNLGCCYFKQEQYGYARYYFERSLFYKPFDKDLFSNLKILYKKILSNPSVGEQIIMNRRILYFIPMIYIITIILILFFSSIILLIFSYKLKKTSKLFFILFSVFCVFTIIFTITFFIQYSNYTKKIFILTSKKANIYIGPDEYEAVILSVNEGTCGVVLDEIDKYLRISINDEISGWIKKENVISNL